MVTVNGVIKTLDTMREIYPFEDDKTIFAMDNAYRSCENSILRISTLDKETGVRVMLEKDVYEEMKKESSND